MQHDLNTWQIDGDGLVQKERLGERCRFINEVFDTWIESADEEQRKAFANDFFEALQAGGAKNVRDIPRGGPNGFEEILLSFCEANRQAKVTVGKLARSVFEHTAKLDIRKLLKEKAFLRCALTFLVGIALIASPGYALEVIGKAGMLGIVIFMAVKISELLRQEGKLIQMKKTRFLLFLLLEAIVLILFLEETALYIVMNMLIGVSLLTDAFEKTRQLLQTRDEDNVVEKIIWGAGAVLSLLFGVVMIVLASQNTAYRNLALGSYLVLAAVFGMIYFLFRERKL